MDDSAPLVFLPNPCMTGRVKNRENCHYPPSELDTLLESSGSELSNGILFIGVPLVKFSLISVYIKAYADRARV